MEFISRTSQVSSTSHIIEELTSGTSGSYDLGFLFFSQHSGHDVQEIIKGLKGYLNIKTVLGCSCAGIIGSQAEIEYQPGISLILGNLPDVRITPFALDQTQLEALTTKRAWYEFFEIFPNEHPTFIIFPDPFLFSMDNFLKALNDFYPQCPIIGGVASAAYQPNQNTLILNDEYFEQGAIGVILTGNVQISTVVSQGCKPIGETFIVTKAQDNVIYELAGKPLLNVLQDVLQNASARDQQLAQDAIFLGVVVNEYKEKHTRGDFLIRGLMGIDENTGAGALGDYIKVGQTVQFHVRDAQTATQDLNEMLKQQTQSTSGKPKGALVFSCNGRGKNLFKEKNHDISIIQNHLGPVPAAGFFCAGEIGPIGGNNFLHGFTDSIALFYPKN